MNGTDRMKKRLGTKWVDGGGWGELSHWLLIHRMGGTGRGFWEVTK